MIKLQSVNRVLCLRRTTEVRRQHLAALGVNTDRFNRGAPKKTNMFNFVSQGRTATDTA